MSEKVVSFEVFLVQFWNEFKRVSESERIHTSFEVSKSVKESKGFKHAWKTYSSWSSYQFLESSVFLSESFWMLSHQLWLATEAKAYLLHTILVKVALYGELSCHALCSDRLLIKVWWANPCYWVLFGLLLKWEVFRCQLAVVFIKSLFWLLFFIPCALEVSFL